jgi:hypothetical protein
MKRTGWIEMAVLRKVLRRRLAARDAAPHGSRGAGGRRECLICKYVGWFQNGPMHWWLRWHLRRMAR